MTADLEVEPKYNKTLVELETFLDKNLLQNLRQPPISGREAKGRANRPPARLSAGGERDET